MHYYVFYLNKPNGKPFKILLLLIVMLKLKLIKTAGILFKLKLAHPCFYLKQTQPSLTNLFFFANNLYFTQLFGCLNSITCNTRIALNYVSISILSICYFRNVDEC